MKNKINRILNFWFEDCNSKDWFKKDKHFDNQIKKNFGNQIEDAVLGYNNDWQKSLKSALALIILTDQFTRNVFRGTPRSFSGDTLALDTCLHCLNTFDISQLKKEKAHFETEFRNAYKKIVKDKSDPGGWSKLKEGDNLSKDQTKFDAAVTAEWSKKWTWLNEKLKAGPSGTAQPTAMAGPTVQPFTNPKKNGFTGNGQCPYAGTILEGKLC